MTITTLFIISAVAFILTVLLTFIMDRNDKVFAYSSILATLFGILTFVLLLTLIVQNGIIK